MKIKCPHCFRTLSLSDDKLRECLPDDDTQAEGDNQLGRQMWIMIIIVAAALAGTVGFGGGALLTRPTRNRTAAEIESVRATAAEEAQQATQIAEQTTKDAQQATAKTRQLEAQVKALYLRIANLTKENQEAWATVKKERGAALAAKEKRDAQMVTKNELPAPVRPIGPLRDEFKSPLFVGQARTLKGDNQLIVEKVQDRQTVIARLVFYGSPGYTQDDYRKAVDTLARHGQYMISGHPTPEVSEDVCIKGIDTSGLATGSKILSGKPLMVTGTQNYGSKTLFVLEPVEP